MDHLNPSKEVLDALSMEGFLDKAKPDALIPINQKRYFQFIEDGRVLAYAAKKEDFGKEGGIKGQILLRDILEVHYDQTKPKKFELVIPDRVYKFSGGEPGYIQKWVKALRILNAFEIDREQNWEKYLKELDPDFVIEDAIDVPDEKTEFFILQPLSFITNTAKKVVVEGAVGTAVGMVKKGVKGVGDIFADTKPKSNQEYLQAKKLHEVLNNIDPAILKCRIKMGMLLRETKEATGLGVVDNLMNDTGMREILVRRWCFLISSKPILHHEVERTDEVTLETSLPGDMRYDTLYMYDESCDSSAPCDVIKMKDVLHVVVKKKVHTEGQFRFVLDLGEKKFNLLCPSFADMDLWLRCIQASRATAGEYGRTQMTTLKNLFWILKLKDGDKDGDLKLQSRIQKDFMKLMTEDSHETPQDIKPLIANLDKVVREYLAVIDACLAYRTQRKDVIQKYEEIFHEGILSALREYFNKHASDLPNGDIFEIMKFLTDYHKNLILFGNSFSDARILDGIALLSKIAGRKILRTNMRAVNNVLNRIMEEDPELDARGRLVTTSPKEVMKYLDDSVKTLNYCNIPEFALQVIQTCQGTMHYLQSGIETLIEKAGLSEEQLIGVCNDTLALGGEVKSFMEVLQNVTHLKADVISLHFNDKMLGKSFEVIGRKAAEKLAGDIFTPISEDPKIKSFLQIDLKDILEKTLGIIDDLIEKLHPSYATAMRSSLLKKTVTFYVQSFLTSAEKKLLKKEQLKEISNKLTLSIKIIKEAFRVYKEIKSAEIEKTLEPVEELEDFLTRSYELLSLAVQVMKQSYGNSLKWSTIEHLLKLREQDIPKDSRDEIMSSCKEVFQATEKSSTSDQDKFNVFKNVSQESDLSLDTSSDSGNSMSRSTISTPKRSFRNPGNSTTMRLTLEGYLTVDAGIFRNVIGLISGGRQESRYFSIRKDFMYCYKDNKSETAEKTINIKDTVECVVEEKLKFLMKVKESGSINEYRFTADSEPRRNAWVKTINNVMGFDSSSRSGSIILDELDTDIYKDSTPLFTEIEKAPVLKYEYTKDPKQRADQIRQRAETMAAQRSRMDTTRTSGGASGKGGKGGNTQSMNTSTPGGETGSKRKKSLTFENGGLIDEDAELPMAKPGFCGAFCMKFGVGKPKPTASRQGSFYSPSGNYDAL